MPRRARTAVRPEPVPLGSLTQRGARAGETCSVCASASLTQIDVRLTDGTEVVLTSCHRCEQRSWRTPDGLPLAVAEVLERSRKTA
ncbi:MAG TPA: hypothetical protein VFS29_07860 [Motilibacteraceae bacterium]|nr:hypothetical protein [Motilibacteraceae bacterium]